MFGQVRPQITGIIRGGSLVTDAPLYLFYAPFHKFLHLETNHHLTSLFKNVALKVIPQGIRRDKQILSILEDLKDDYLLTKLISVLLTKKNST